MSRRRKARKPKRLHPLHRQAQEHVGNMVRHYRRAQGLRLVDLAEKAGVSERTVRRVESGKSPVTVATLAEVATGLEVTMQTLVPGYQLLGEVNHED